VPILARLGLWLEAAPGGRGRVGLDSAGRGIFGVHGSVPTKGWRNTARLALGAIIVYQLALLYRFEHHLDPNVGLKPFLQAA
jgi:hypothetical protein